MLVIMNYLIVIFVLCCCLPYKTVQEKIPEKSKDVKRDLDSLFKSKLTGFKLDKNIIAADTGITESPYVKLQRGENTEISKQHNCKQEENCFLPTCFCKTVKYPFMKLTSIPQIVYFAFSGSLKMEHWMILNKLFNGRRRNPDNRMATMSIYVCGQGIDYDVVKYFYDNKHDIGVCGTITDGNYIQIVQKGDIPVNGLVGFKCLTSETLCNGNDDYLHDLGYSYIIRQNAQEKNLLWPYTSIINKKSVGISNMQHNKEFWNIPVNGIFQNNGSICVSNNNCLKTGSDQRVMFDFIWNKFKHTFKTSRSPFGIHLDLNDFLDDIYIKVLDNLISKLLQLKDVFIVDVLKMIKWIRHPKGTNSLSQFKPWDVEHTGLKEETQQKSRLTKKLIHYIRNDTSVAVSAKDAVHSKSGFLQADMPSTQNGHCYQGLNCKLPSCFCPTHKFPMAVNEIPQIIYFGFDDHLNQEHQRIYDKLFFTNKKNPNGCPITISLYVSNTATNYNVARYYYEKGNDIGVHSVTHKLIKTRSTLLQEANDQLMNLVIRAGIPRDKITGWRSPYLETAGDIQIDVLQQLGLQYDISLIKPFMSKVNDSHGSHYEPPDFYWPFTLDHTGWPFICYIPPCPKRSHKGFWEVPLNELADITKTGACSMTDDCPNSPKNENEVFHYLWYNFEINYKRNRAPFGIHLHPTWFKSEFNLNGLDKFIQESLKLKNVYIVSVQKMLEWIRNPVSVDKITQFKPWLCN